MIGPNNGAVINVLSYIPTQYWDGIRDGTNTDLSTYIQQAITDAAINGNKLICTTPLKIYSTITIINNVIFDFQGNTVTQAADVDLFHVNEGGSLKNIKIDATGSYTSNVVTLSPTQNIRGAQFKEPWAQNVSIEMDFDTGTGNAIVYDASSYYIQETIATNLSIYWGDKAVYMIHGSTSAQYCNGNIINGLNIHDSYYAIYEDSTTLGRVSGNCYNGVMIEKNSYGSLYLNRQAMVSGVLWDGPAITFKSFQNRIISSEMKSLLITLTDEGVENRISGQDGEYYDGKSISNYDDARANYVNLPGKIEFRDFFDDYTLNPKWHLAGVGTPSGAFSSSSLGGSTYKLITSRYGVTTSTGASDTGILQWGSGHIQTGQSPRIHVTFLAGSTTDVTFQIGLYISTNTYIIFESDVVTPKWICRCNNAGSETTADITTNVNFNQLQSLSIIIENDSVIFQQGNKSTSTINVAWGRYNLEQTQTITTNIPVNTNLLPYLAVKNGAAAAKIGYWYDFQIIRKWYTKVSV